MLSAVSWRLRVPEVKVFLPAACTSPSTPSSLKPLSFLQRIDSRGLGLLLLLTNAGLGDQALGQRQTETESGKLSAKSLFSLWGGGVERHLCASLTDHSVSACNGGGRAYLLRKDPHSCRFLPGGLKIPALQSSHLSLQLLTRRPCPGWQALSWRASVTPYQSLKYQNPSVLLSK